MIHFKCQHCRQDITAAEQNAGKRAKCPKCQHTIVIPASEPNVEVVEDEPEERPSTAVRGKPESAPRSKPRAATARPANTPTDGDIEELEELEAAEEDFEVVEGNVPEALPPRRRRKKRRRRTGEYADCPHCGCPGDADRVSFTL